VKESCPFCGASTDLPHESQEACIAALQQEIARTREIVERVKLHSLHVDSGNDPTPETDRHRRH
jgi:coproporphyrinogen III oxidase-like Fe-S oxidoreductase